MTIGLDRQNRVLARILVRREQLARGVKVDGTPIDPNADLVAVERGLDNTPAEHAAYQNLKTAAQAMGVLTVDEAMTVYMALGEAPGPSGWSSEADLATKIVITALMLELVERRIKR